MLTFKSLFRKSVFLLFCLYHIRLFAVCQPLFWKFLENFCRLTSFIYRNEFVRSSSSWKICSVVFSSFLIWNNLTNIFINLVISTYLLGISLLFIYWLYQAATNLSTQSLWKSENIFVLTRVHVYIIGSTSFCTTLTM